MFSNQQDCVKSYVEPDLDNSVNRVNEFEYKKYNSPREYLSNFIV